MLLPNEFVRCHRAHVVNIAHIKQLQALSGSRWRLLLSNGVEIPVGRAYIGALLTALGI